MSADRVLVFIPAFNEQDSIVGVIEDVHRELPGADVLVVDDGSTDKTAARARASGALVAPLPFNHGIGVAHQTGFLYAHRHGYTLAGQLDADGQHRASDLRALLDLVAGGDADLAIGSRFVDGATEGFRSSPMRRTGIRLFAGMIRLLTRSRFYDVTSGLRAANRRVIALFAKRYPHDYAEIESLQRVLRQGVRVRELPVHMQPRRVGESHITPWRSAYYVWKVGVMLLIGAIRPREVEDDS